MPEVRNRTAPKQASLWRSSAIRSCLAGLIPVIFQSRALSITAACSCSVLGAGPSHLDDDTPLLNGHPGTPLRWAYSEYFLRPRFFGGLLLSLLLLFISPGAVRATAGQEANGPDCAQAGLNSQPVAVQLTRSAELVQAALHSAPSGLPAAGCLAPLQFQVPEDARPPQAVWRDVEGRTVRVDGTPDPAHPVPLPLRLWIHPDGNLDYEVREAGTNATHVALNLEVAWGTTAAANDLAVLDILSTALGLDLDILKPIPEVEEELWAFKEELWALGAWLNDSGRVWRLDWYAIHPSEEMDFWVVAQGTGPEKWGIHPPDVRTTWQLPSELGQLTALSRVALGGPLLTGTIPPELGQLANLEQLTLAGSRLTGAVPPELGQLAKLWKLELHDNRLTLLPSELGRLSQLAVLTLADNRLTSLPPELGLLTRLAGLGLAGNRLTSLPPELGRLTWLRKLGLAGNRLTVLPPELGQLPSLVALDVQNNRLTFLPSLAGLKQLEYLDLSGNRLTRVPPGLGQLPMLSHLDLSDNRLTTLPSAWLRPRWSTVVFSGGLLVYKLVDLVKHGTAGLLSPGSSLKVLDLSGNRLTDLPTALGRLRLVRLDLSDNRLTALPPSIGRLRPPAWFAFFHGAEPHLTLDLSGNRLTALPPELGRIADLVQLDLGDNRLTDLPAALFRLDRLHTLNLSGNQLGTVPPELGDLTTLETLGLGDNQLTDLPPELGQLPQLVSLDLSGNQLRALPPELAQAANLSHLNLSDNQLTGLPAGLVQLSQLDSLDLSHNQLSDLSDLAAELEQVAKLPRWLIRLDLSDNQLTAVPPVLVQLNALEVLHLSHNQLTDQSLTLDHLKHNLTHLTLTQLDLSHNQLTDLPLELDHLKYYLIHLDLSHNRFSEIPPALSQLRPLLSLDLRGNPLTTCPLPLPWQIDRYIYPPDENWGVARFFNHVNFDYRLLSPMSGTEPSDLPFLDLCPE